MKESFNQEDMEVFINTIVECRDDLEPIVIGEIVREYFVGDQSKPHCGPGYRKTMLKDAKAIAKSVMGKINRAIAKLEE